MTELVVTVLGCGPSGGVPLMGCGCAVCQSPDPKNKRLRASILLEQGGKRLLVDTSPDLRQQALRADFAQVDAILYTHAHADHCHGIDDTRSFNFNSGAAVPAYGDERTLGQITTRFPYAFRPPQPSAGVWTSPALVPNVIGDMARVEIAGLSFQTFLQHHGKGRSLGYRLGNFAYSTDVDNLPERSLQLLEKLDVWLVDCLQATPAVSHATLPITLEWIEKLKPKRAILTHMSHEFDYVSLKAQLPPHIEPAYDGMRIVMKV